MIWTLQTLFGQFFDAMVGQMVDALGGPRPVHRSSPWGGGAPRGDRLSLPPAPGADNGDPPSQGPAWEPARGGTAAVARQERRTAPQKDLDDDAIKLVKYALVSIRRCHEKVLTGGVILATTPMTSTSFSSWIIAEYLQSKEYQAAVALDRSNEITPADKKYLRVSWGVLCRWPREPKSGCGESKVNALKDIRNAILGLRQPLPPRPAPPPPAPYRETGALPQESAEPEAAVPEGGEPGTELVPTPEAAPLVVPPEETAAPPAGELVPTPEAAAPVEGAPAAGETTLSTEGEIPAQAPESVAPVPEEPPLPEGPRPEGRPPGRSRRRTR